MWLKLVGNVAIGLIIWFFVLPLHPQILQTFNLLTKEYESVRDRFHYDSRFI